MRECLQHADGFDTAAKWLRTSELIAPCYVIMAGATEGRGEVITRSRSYEANPHPDSLLELHTAPHGAIVQANADQWIDDPALDVTQSAVRCSRVHEALRARAQSETAKAQWSRSLWEVMSRYPVYNQDTIYGTLMVPALGVFETRMPSYEPM